MDSKPPPNNGKPPTAKDDFPQISKATNMPQNEPVKNDPKEQNQPKKQKKPSQSNEPKPTVKTQEVPQKQSKAKDDFPQMSKATNMPQNEPVKNDPKEQNQPKKQKKPSQSNEPKPTVKTQEVPQKQSKAKDDFPQMSKATNMPQNEPVKNDPKKQNQPKKQKKPSQSNEPKPTDKTQEVPQKQSKAKDDFPQMSKATNMPQNEPVKNDPKKQNQPKKQKKPSQSNEPKPTVKTQEVSQEQSKGKDDFPQMSKSSIPQNQSNKQSNVSAKTPEEGKISQQQNQNSQPQIQQIIEIFKHNLTIPKRSNPKAGGKKGRVTEIDVNHLPLNLDKLFTKTIYHIDVLFKPELPRRLLRNALEEFNHRHYPNVQFAFDGRKNMYTTKEIRSRSDVVSILNEENNRSIEFTIITTVVKEISMAKIKEYLLNGSSNSPPGEAFQALDIVLKNRPFSLRFTNIGRSFFPVPRITPVDLGEGMELWKGFFQSPVMGWKPYLNIDVAHKGFPKCQPLISYIQNEMRFNPHSEMDYRNMGVLLNYIKGLKVDFLVPNQPNTKRSYKVLGLLESAANFYFSMDNGVKLNVLQYFQRTRNYNIKYPNLPCLHVGKVENKTAIPIELCTVTRGQLRMKKLSEMQTAVMVKNAARPPAERRQTIENCIKDIKYNEDPVLREFGIEVKEYFATVPARVLEQPSLSYWQDKETKPRSGVWRADKFSKSVILSKWVVFNLDERTNMSSIKNFENGLIRSGADLNVTVHPMYPVKNHFLRRNCRLNEVQVEVTNFFNKAKADGMELIVVIIPDGPAGIYATVKQSSELTVGVLTQCIKSKTMSRMNPSTASNIMLKINSKLNGINHTLKNKPICMKDAIIFGADVSHPSPDQTDIPSVAAVAASHDIHGSQYNMEWRLQDPKVEIIQELEDIVHKQLCKFRERTNIVPKKIIYFRDGVSEGQFLQLLNEELVAIRRACLRLNIKYTPNITFLVVQKRHHTRMFPKHNIDMDGKFCNVPSGTIVDTHITHPTEIDFYLCSHASIQGTARPTKYHLLWNDSELSEDELEQLTFHLCFMFARCTRSVSYPAPTYYAHLAAFRARSYIENKSINLSRLGEEQVKNTLNALFTTTNPMFFV